MQYYFKVLINLIKIVSFCSNFIKKCNEYKVILYYQYFRVLVGYNNYFKYDIY